MKIQDMASGGTAVKGANAHTREQGFWALNWLRFFLAVYIVLYHTLKGAYPSIEGTWFQAALSLGNMATSVFFVLSGFLLMHVYVVRKDGRRFNKRNFFVARFSTLYPLHIAGLVVALGPLVSVLLSRGLTVSSDALGGAERVLASWEIALSFLMTVTLTNAWNPYYILFNGPSWSLSALAFFYIVFAYSAVKIYRMKAPMLALVLLGGVFLLPGAIADLLHLKNNLTEGLLHRNPILRLPLFVAGMLLCVIFARSRNAGAPGQLLASAIIVLATVIAATIMLHDGSTMHLIQNGMYFPASLAIIWLCACARPMSSARIRIWGERLGGAALPMFLLHLATFSLFRKVEQLLTVMASGNGGSLSSMFAASRGVEPSLALYPLFLILVTVVCVLVQEQFVVRVQKIIRNRMNDRTESGPVTERTERQQAAG